MRLSDFILSEMDTIVLEWEAFAATRLPAAASMGQLALRDHAEQILAAVAADLRTSQSPGEQIRKSHGLAEAADGAPETAAQTHAVLRAKSGFDINQLASEYRALRACVLRLWMADSQPDPHHIQDIIRFNEAIDQSLAESIEFFSAQVERSRDLLLGTLGHELRSPLQIILLTADHLSTLDAGPEVSESASLLIESSRRMKALLEDLLDFNRTKLGVGVNINPTLVDLSSLLIDEIKQLRAAHPHRRIEFMASGGTDGLFDGLRLQRLLENLVVNGIKYGFSDTPVQVVLDGSENEVLLEVKNSGPAIDPDTLLQLFDPLKRGADQSRAIPTDGSLGLGLYIANEIVKAHGGSISVRSEEPLTVFEVRLPRSRP